MHRLRRADKPGGPLDAAHQVSKMLADDTGMATAGSADPGGCAEQFHGFGKLFLVKMFLHLQDTRSLDIISIARSQDCFVGNHKFTFLYA
jgi:hypothetical protein